MKRLIALLGVFFLIAVFVSAQEFGAIKGAVKDADGIELPGVTVTLTGSKIAPMSAITSEKGNFRFLNLPVADDYVLKLELEGFNTVIREELVISYGRDVNLNITMKMTELREEIVVRGEAPVIDTKKVRVGVNLNEEMIMSLPSARNPWTILSLIPGMLIDREDVGGNEGGQQSHYYGHGSDKDDSTWNVDGANITDNSALGSAPAYLNISSYEEVEVNYGSNDIRAQTGGVQINLITRRGGNDYRGMFYLDVIRNAWQADNVPQELTDIGYTASGINRLYLYGANFGGPLIKDKLWFFGSWGIQDIDKLTLAGTSDKTWLASGYARLDFQLTNSTRANAFVQYDNKQKWNRAAFGATVHDADTLWNQVGPGYFWKGEVEQMFGNLYLNAKFMYTNGGFNLAPVQGPRTSDGSGNYMVLSYYPTFRVEGNILDYGTDRDQINVNVYGDYFAENVLGADHEIKFGVDYVQATTTTFSYYEGNLYLFYFGPDETLPTGEWWQARLLRDYLLNYGFTRYSAFIQDTITVGRFAVNFGLRYDQEKSLVKDANIPASPWLPQFMPAVSLDEFDPGAKWTVFSPRFSVAYDLFGTGKDVIKFSVAQYGSQSGNDLADNINPIGWTWIDALWQDSNGDGRVTNDELYGYDWDTGELKDVNDPDYWIDYSCVDPDNPTEIKAMDKYDPDYNSPRLLEIGLSYEKELITDFAGRLELFYKKRSGHTWGVGMDADGVLETEDNYYVAGHDDSVDYDYYGRYENYPYTYYTNHKKMFDRYLGAQIVLTKRLSNRWMLNTSFTFSDWRRYYEGEYLGTVFDMLYPDMNYGLSNQEYFDSGVVAPESGGSGERYIYSNTRWIFKLSGLYQMPLGFNLSGSINAREGYVYATHVLVQMPGIGFEELYGSPDGKGKYGDERLPTFWVINMRLEKVFPISEGSSVTFSADVFNLTNSAHALKKERRIDSDNFGQAQQILSPRVFRIGIRFNF
jgi:hypothetical protein